ncbi:MULTISPECIES: aspartate aminotransferase family protein [Paenibacillus]|uniref:aspartate aminotransferase family protein n=1 Tax=Paenibacillus TaxID=44249 RepID=UPI00096C6274|nr:aspartate aminotransferase family protein [Paenibacillus odorifer]MEC0133046.1 aspartate aminotransferase family protein [Paenibacillus odorifer]MEC0223481.1 aspartate aminotransferase family protein [Paenibacillus odorifer]OMD12266.1 aspartate aminotransferase family protein [Paenibacillus odorifer]OMD25614.1 aspartate aminotransferase family protein [Paenibacillus odorifer]OME35225.1 aspartate aminotransferase family protein [Paenibacillus odorifer]
MSKLTQAELDSQAGAQQTDTVGSGTPDVTAGKLSAVFPSYARYDLSLVKGKGTWVWDDKGNKYLDFTSGLAVTSLGHAPEKVGAKLKDQIDTLWHVSNLFHIPGQDEVANLLTENSCADQVFFCNSGAEANEAAIKLARRYHQKIKGVDRYEVITFEQSFHGRTLATLTATGQQKVKEGFLPLPAGFKTVPLHDLPALEAAIGDHTAAIMLEMVLAEGGVLEVEPEFLNAVVALCKKHGLLLIVDEVQTGMGRTGKLFAHQHYGIEPDIFTLAKGIASGFPAGLMLGKGYLREAFSAGSHASTFGGTPLATAVMAATIETMLEDELPQRAEDMGKYLTGLLKEKLADCSFVKDIRGKGLLIGIECQSPVGDIVLAGQKKGLLFVTAGPNVLRLLPNLYVSKEEIDQAVDILCELIHTYAKQANGEVSS